MSKDIKGLSTQQGDFLAALLDREEAGRGAQSAQDFEGFLASSTYSRRNIPCTTSSARSVLERLVCRGFVERVDGRPRTYRLTGRGRAVVLPVFGRN